MKINLLLLFCFVLSCNYTKNKVPEDIIKKEIFITVLKEVHLAEAIFELNKSKKVESVKQILDKTYAEIYLSHNIDKDKFEKTLFYYINHPEELEQIYSKVLKELEHEKTTLNP